MKLGLGGFEKHGQFSLDSLLGHRTNIQTDTHTRCMFYKSIFEVKLICIKASSKAVSWELLMLLQSVPRSLEFPPRKMAPGSLSLHKPSPLIALLHVYTLLFSHPTDHADAALPQAYLVRHLWPRVPPVLLPGQGTQDQCRGAILPCLQHRDCRRGLSIIFYGVSEIIFTYLHQNPSESEPKLIGHMTWLSC